MAGRLLTDELWNEIEPLFPTWEQSSKGGTTADRQPHCLHLHAVHAQDRHWLGDLPTELGACEKTVRRRLNTWKQQDLWTAIFHRLLTKLRAAGRLDLAEVLIDGGLIKAPCGGENADPTSPTEAEAAVN